MTAKLKKKLKLIGLIASAALTIGALVLTARSSDLFSMPANAEDTTTNKSNVQILGDTIVCDSLVQGVRDVNLPDGTYTFRVTGKKDNGAQETKDYLVEFKNEYNDVIYTTNQSLGDNSKEYKMLVVKYHGNLTINSGVKVTANTSTTTISGTNYELCYKKGMFLCVMGKLTNKGEISMTARGTYNQAGENVYLWKNTDESFAYVPDVGGAGAKGGYRAAGGTVNGTPGEEGKDRATGGGGSGQRNYGTGGAGGNGTSYSGGTGGGGGGYDNKVGTKGSDIGGPGGDGAPSRTSASGGTGNPGGAYRSNTGTGGLLIVYAGSLNNANLMTANGVDGGTGWPHGGASGGGSINVFAKKVIQKGTYTVNGGTSQGGGNGAKGKATVDEIMPYINYADKKVEMHVGETYSIDMNAITYETVSGLEETVTKGRIQVEVLDTSVAEMDTNNVITARACGITKVKITDIDNDTSTYILLEVINNARLNIQEGKNYTVALKENGTVWTYGINTNGQLGTGSSNQKEEEPVKVEGLNNIRQIATGYSHTLALKENGEVYAWGVGTKGQIGDGSSVNRSTPVKVAGLSDIIKIDAYKNISLAVSKDGKLYAWGEGYSTIPMRIMCTQKIVDVSGMFAIASNGKVYNITNLNKMINGLNNIIKISCGEAHNLAMDIDGNVYSWGTNNYGECGVETTGTSEVHFVASNISEISAGNQTSLLKAEDGKVYAIGNNDNGQIGLSTSTKATTPTLVSLSENVKIVNVCAGEGTHSGLVDENGFVWHSGLNTYGEIGIGNTTQYKTFVKNSDTIINTHTEDNIYLDLGESITLYNVLENTFNLKIDIIDDIQSHFTITTANTDKLDIQGNDITLKNFGKATVTVRHIGTGKTKEIYISGIRKLESIVQGIRDNEFSDGEYQIMVQDVIYDIEIYNYYTDVRYSLQNGETSRIEYLGDNTADEKMLVVKYHGDLTIDKGVTLTASQRKKGMYVCVLRKYI